MPLSKIILTVLIICSVVYIPNYYLSKLFASEYLEDQTDSNHSNNESINKSFSQELIQASDSSNEKEWLQFKELYEKGKSFHYKEEGIPYFEKAYSLLSYSKLDTSEKSTFLNTYYHFLGYNNRWEDALPIAQLCMVLRESLNENPPLAYLSTVHDMAYIHNKIGNYEEAIDYYQNAIDGYLKYNGYLNHDVALSYNNIAFNYGLIGMANKQYEHYLKAADIWSNIDLEDNSYLLTVYGNLLRWQKQYGDLTAMEATITQLKQVVQKKSKGWGKDNRLLKNVKDVRSDQLILSFWKACLDYYSFKNDLDGVQLYFDSTRMYFEENQHTTHFLEYLDNAYSVLGEVYAENGNHPQAIQIFKSGLLHLNKRNYIGSLEHTHAKLGKTYLGGGLLDSAQVHLQLAIQFSKSDSNLPLYHTLFAELNQKRSQLDSVRYHVQKTISHLTRDTVLKHDFSIIDVQDFSSKVNKNYISCLSSNGHSLLKVYLANGQLDDLYNANHLFKLALEMLNSYYLGGPYTNSLAEIQSAIHNGLLQCQSILQKLSSNDHELSQLFEQLENNRSQHQWKKFIKHAPNNSLSIPDSLQQVEEDLRQKSVYYKQQLSLIQKDSSHTDQANKWRVKIHTNELRLSELEKQILSMNDQYLRFSKGMIQTKTLQKELSRHVSMLRYMFTDSGAFVMLIDQTSLHLYSLGDTDSIHTLIKNALHELHQRNDSYYQTSVKLYQRLFTVDMIKRLKKNLVIIPDGLLHQFPFEALSTSGKPSDFLLNQYIISYASHTSLWLSQQGMRHSEKQHLGAIAPTYIGEMGVERNLKLQTLKGAATESTTIAEMLGGTVYLEPDFGKDDFIKIAQNYTLLHLAMHTDVQEENSEHSNFHFGDGSKLYAYELYGMKLKANMAVLSACNTGNGIIQKGEGIQSLATAFTYAGVPSLVIGLWSLPDQSTSKIMIDYYQQLKNNDHKNKALAKAKLNYLQGVQDDIELQHPYYWAGLVMTGDITPLFSSSVIKWAIAILLLVLLIIWMVQQKRKSLKNFQ